MISIVCELTAKFAMRNKLIKVDKNFGFSQILFSTPNGA